VPADRVSLALDAGVSKGRLGDGVWDLASLDGGEEFGDLGVSRVLRE